MPEYPNERYVFAGNITFGEINEEIDKYGNRVRFYLPIYTSGSKTGELMIDGMPVDLVSRFRLDGREFPNIPKVTLADTIRKLEEARERIGREQLDRQRDK